MVDRNHYAVAGTPAGQQGHGKAQRLLAAEQPAATGLLLQLTIEPGQRLLKLLAMDLLLAVIGNQCAGGQWLLDQLGQT